MRGVADFFFFYRTDLQKGGTLSWAWIRKARERDLQALYRLAVQSLHPAWTQAQCSQRLGFSRFPKSAQTAKARGGAPPQDTQT